MRRTWFLGGLCLATVAWGQQIYVWTDADGEEHYTNDPASIPRTARARPVPLEGEDEVVVRPLGETTAPGAAGLGEAAPPASGDGGAASGAPTPAVAERSGREQRVLSRLDRTRWRAAPEDERDVANAEVFVALAARPEPEVAAAALKAAHTLCTPNPGAPATIDGRPLERVRCSDAYHRVVVSHLGDPDWRVRSAAALAAEWGAWGPRPVEAVWEALTLRLALEQRDEVADLVRAALWSCHGARPAMIDAALTGLASPRRSARAQALSQLALVGRAGRDFDAPDRDRMRRAAEPLLEDPAPVLREQAVFAWAANTEPARGLARMLVLARDPQPIVRWAALRSLGRWKATAALPTVAAALGDLAPIDVRAEGDLGGAHGFVVAQAALEALGELAREVHGAAGFEVTRFEGPPSPAELAAELARAQAWYAAHRGR